MSLATFEDVNSRYYREIDEEDRQLIETRLEDAELMIRRKIPDLDYRLAQEDFLLPTVIRVCADAVIRLINNPEGYVQETDGSYTYMLRQRLEDGRLMLTKEEWADLGIQKRIAVIHMIPQRGRLV